MDAQVAMCPVLEVHQLCDRIEPGEVLANEVLEWVGREVVKTATYNLSDPDLAQLDERVTHALDVYRAKMEGRGLR